jgi:hypothetical protein
MTTQIAKKKDMKWVEKKNEQEGNQSGRVEKARKST